MSSRSYLYLGVLALVIVCVTVLGAMRVVDPDRVLDLMSSVVASFLGAMAGAGMLRISSSSSSSTPPPGRLGGS